MSKESKMKRKARREAREAEEGRKVAMYVGGALILLFVLALLWANYA